MITIQMIDEFRRRTNASYDDARYFLERHDGDMLESVIDFEKARTNNYGKQQEKPRCDFGNGVMRMLQKLFDIKIIVTDKNEKTIPVPIFIPIVLFPIWHVIILLAIVMMIMGFKFGVRETQEDSINVQSIFNKLRDRVRAGSRNY